MRPTFDSDKIRIPESEIRTCQRVLDTRRPKSTQFLISRTEEINFSYDLLIELKAELIKLKTSLYQSQDAFKIQSLPLNSLIEHFQTQRFFSQQMQPYSNRSDMTKYKTPASQKTSAQPKNLVKNQNISNPRGSERSIRLKDRTSQSSSGNPLDVWYRSEPLFSPLPSPDEISSIFHSIIEKSIKNASMKAETPVDKTTHWSVLLYDKIQKLSKDNKKMPKLLPPPGPPPSPSSISEYWESNQPSFPIETVQKQNSSVMHHLLSAVVEVDPLPASDSKEKKPYLPIHVLAPRLKHDRYLSLNFDTRLDLELKSIGLDDCGDNEMNKNDTFSDEIASMKEKISKLIPVVENDARQLLEKLQTFRKVEDQHYTEQTMFNELLQIAQSKKRKK